jgi:transposase
VPPWAVARSLSVIDEAQLQTLGAQELRETVRAMMADLASKSATIERHERETAFNRATIDKLTHEMAVLKRLKFAAKSEAFTAEQKSLLEETIDADLAALAQEIEQRAPADDKARAIANNPNARRCRRSLPRTEFRHEPDSTTCRLWLPTPAHRRRRGREAGLHARRVHG